jgi:hypothetical protein
MGIRIGIGNTLIGQADLTAWQNYWKQQADVLGLYFLADLAAGKIYNRVKGRETEYLTVTGASGAENFQCPNIQAYIDADTDFIWFKTDHSQRPATSTAELVGYDLQHTPVKFGNASPNAIECIMILANNLSQANLFRLHHDFTLPIMWSGAWIDYGYEKSNRSNNEQQLWTPEAVIHPTVSTATVETGAPANVVLTFSNALDNTSVPASSAFAIAGKTINNVAVAGAVVTLTVTVPYVFGNSGITVAYTAPSTNKLRAASAGGVVNDFSGQAVTNNVAPATSYANAGGTGDRRASITISTNMGMDASYTTLNDLINGNTSTTWGLMFSDSTAGHYIQFSWGAGISKIINELKWYQSAAYAHGVLKLMGSQSDVSNPADNTFEDVGSNFTLTANTVQTITAMASNTKAYRHYRIVRVSGGWNTNDWQNEVEFKIY